jgi:hypothetical protein
MPYYGDLLADLAEPHTHRPAHDGHVHMPLLISKTGQRMLLDVGKLLCVNKKKLANEIVRSNVAGSEWVQVVLSALDSDIPGFSPLLLRFVRQVDAYLKSPKTRTAVDNLVRPCLLDSPTVVVAHSLGSVIAYRLLRKVEKKAEVPLLVTLGSPLGICTIKEHLSPPSLAFPAAVNAWLNATDEKDCVAFHSRLDHDTFIDGIENVVSVKHSKDNPHDICDYLGNRTVAKRIHTALTRAAVVTRPGRAGAVHVSAASARIYAPPRKTPG